MKRYTAEILSEQTGLMLTGATLQVVVPGTNTRVTLYATDNQEGATIEQPVPNGAGFYVPDGRYDILATGPRGTKRLSQIDMFDGFEQNRRLEAVENGEPGAPGSLRSDLQQTNGAQRIGFGSRTIADKFADYVSVKDTGAVGDGVVDDTASIQAATNTGRPVYFPAGIYFMSAHVERLGQVTWFGEGEASTIVCDGLVLVAIAASGSRVDNLRLMNKTAPWTIVRNSADWSAVPAVVQSNDGYQPTTNDADVWLSLTQAQQSQNIGPKLQFRDNADGIVVSRIYGRFVSILMYDTANSVVHDCSFKAGKNFAGGIVFWNINGQIGRNNRAFNNRISLASFNGVAFARNVRGAAYDNFIERVGESGVKTWQGIVATLDARCYDMSIQRNDVMDPYFDGIDGSADYPHAGTAETRLSITENTIRGARQTGVFADGLGLKVMGNRASGSGDSGISLTVDDSMIHGNTAIGNNGRNAVAGAHELLVIGDENSITANRLVRTAQHGSCLFAPGANFVSANRAIGGAINLGSAGEVTSLARANAAEEDDRDDQTQPIGVRQMETGNAALQLYHETTAFDDVLMDFFPRRHLLQNPIAKLRAWLALGESGNELGFMQMLATRNGVSRPGLTLAGRNQNGSHTGLDWVEIHVPSEAPPFSIDTSAGTVAFWVDTAANKLRARVAYANGTVKSGAMDLI